MDNNYKILLVDDLVDNLKIMISTFKEYCPNYEILQTCNPEFAIEIAGISKPKLIITDWDMPKMSGIELIKKLKDDDKTKDIPVMIATGVMLESENLKIALDAGAIDFISKPIDPIELVARTSSVIRNSLYNKEKLEHKDKELTENNLYLVKTSTYNQDIIKKFNHLQNLIHEDNNDAKAFISGVVKELEDRLRIDSWHKFSVSFGQVHKDFNKNLINKFPYLTVNDLKLCAFLRLGINIKEMAVLMNQTPDSVKVARSRLRKKLNLERTQNIETYLLLF